MPELRVRLLGGFDVQLDGEPVRSIESRKAKALLAYLMLNRKRTDLTRGHLATMLWPDEDEETGRQNLRQAVYSLRRTLGDVQARAAENPIMATKESVVFNSATRYWCDVEAFERALSISLVAGECRSPGVLSEAVGLYRGPLLSGFFVDDSPEFEAWLLGRQDRLRELALTALRGLVLYHSSRGELDQGIHHGGRWLELDPVSEEAHRALMRMYAMSGRRSRAVAQYEVCRQVLSVELGVEPMSETDELMESILEGERSTVGAGDSDHARGPFIPFVGRRAEYCRMLSLWKSVTTGAGRLTLVTGDEGVGKSRLVKSVLHDASTQSSALVLVGRCQERELPVCYEPIAEVLRSAYALDVRCADVLRTGIASGELAPLALLATDLLEMEVHTAVPDSTDLRSLVDAFLRFLTKASVAHATPVASGIIVLLEDLHNGDGPTLRFVQELATRLDGQRIWIVCTSRGGEIGSEDAPLGRGQGGKERPRMERLPLGLLDGVAVEQVARQIVRDSEVSSLSHMLMEHCGGRPVVLTELINLMRDEGVLVPAEAGHWSLAGDLEAWAASIPLDLEALILRRVGRLPSSTRRLLTLGGVIGSVFDAELLDDTADEHKVVIETGLGVLLERWFARYSPWCWFENRRERDLELWRQGVRKGRFEFTHSLVHRSVQDAVDPLRRRMMHLQVGEALESRFARKPQLACEDLAHHFLMAETWERALPHLQASAHRALWLDAPDVARTYIEKGVLATIQLEAVATSDREVAAWAATRRELEGLLATITTFPAGLH